MTADAIDGYRFFSGGSSTEAFVNPLDNEFWPKQGSVLIDKAIEDLTPKFDFNHTLRKSTSDVGAYETEELFPKPGWKVSAGL